MAETQTKSIMGQDAERAQEKKRRLEPAPVTTKVLADESTPVAGLLGVSAMELPLERHAAFLGDPRFSHPANNAQKAGLVTELQQSYGNAYIQRVVGLIQAKKDEALPEEEPDLTSIGQRIAQEKGSGQPLESGTRTEMEASFGKDLSDVRVHTDAEADRLSKDLSAKAFTTGKDVFFREGTYQPGSEASKGLLAHELTHVVQQASGIGGRSKLVGQVGDALEKEAARASRAVGEGGWVSIETASAVPALQRQAAEAPEAEAGDAIQKVPEEEARATVPDNEVIEYYWKKRKGPGGWNWAARIHKEVNKIFWERTKKKVGYKLDPKKPEDAALIPKWFEVLVEVLRPLVEAVTVPKTVRYMVPLIPQPNDESCWAAAMAMVVSYYRGTTTPEQIADRAGINLEMCYDWGPLYAAAMAYGLERIPPGSYTAEIWSKLLVDHGPLWVVEIDTPHSVVLTGISGNTVYINDPWPPGIGKAGPRPFEEFARRFGEAADVVGEDVQILYYK